MDEIGPAARPVGRLRVRPRLSPGIVCCGLLLAGSAALQPAMAAPQSAAYVREVIDACVKASNLHNPKPAGKVIGFDDQVGMSALLIQGQVMLTRKKSRPGRVLCLFDKVTHNPFIADANSLVAGFR